MKEILTAKAKEVMAKIEKGFYNFDNTTIEGGLWLKNITIPWLSFRATIHSGCIDLEETTIEQGIDLEGAVINGGLYLKKATVKGDLNLKNAVVKNCMDLSTKKGPKRILVNNLEMAQLVHLAAPTIPIIIGLKD